MGGWGFGGVRQVKVRWAGGQTGSEVFCFFLYKGKKRETLFL